MKKRIFSKALALLMALSLLSSTAFAASFAELQGAINDTGNSNGQAMENNRYGYAANGDGTYGIEAWNSDDGTRNVKLNENVLRENGEASVTIDSGNVTIDMNGSSIGEKAKANSDSSASIQVKSGATLTVENSVEKAGTISGTGDSVIENNGTLNLGNGTTVNANQYIVSAKYKIGTGIYTTGEVNIAEGAIVNGGGSGVKYKGTSYKGTGVNVDGGTVNTAGTITGFNAVNVSNGKVTVNEGKVSGNSSGIFASGNDALVEVNGGEITGGTFMGITLQEGASGIINDGATVTGGNSGIQILGQGRTDTDEMAKLTVNGGTITGKTNTGIIGNGTTDWTNYGGTIITINGGDIYGEYVGIYHPQYGFMTVNGGTITGGQWSGIEMRAGNLTINGGTISGNTEIEFEVNPGPQGGGATTKGAGLAIAQHVTQQPINVTINGGTIIGAKSMYESNPEQNGDSIKEVHPIINGGHFVSTKGSVYSEDEQFFVSGGFYSEEVNSDYLADIPLAGIEQTTVETATGKVSCIQTSENSKLPYHVGYLTGAGGNVSMTPGSSRTLEPTYSLSNIRLDESNRPMKDENGDYVYKTEHVSVLSNVIDSTVPWTSSDDSVVTVADDGTVTAVGVGTATITATLINGETVTFTVTVAESTDITPGETNPDGTIPDTGLTGGTDANTTTIEDEETPLAGLFTRGDAIGYLWEQSGSPEAELSDFEDVPEDHYWAVAIGWAQDMGIALPDEDGNFRPDDLVLRSSAGPEGELQEFLNRYAIYAGIELDEGELFIELEGAADDIVMGEDAQIIFDEFFAKLDAALKAKAA